MPIRESSIYVKYILNIFQSSQIPDALVNVVNSIKRKVISVHLTYWQMMGDDEPGCVIDSTSLLHMDESYCEDERVYTGSLLLMLLHLMVQIKPNSTEQTTSSALGQSLSNSWFLIKHSSAQHKLEQEQYYCNKTDLI